MEFLTWQFLDTANAVDGSDFDDKEAVFNHWQAIIMLNRDNSEQSVDDTNPTFSGWNHLYSPITYLLISSIDSIPTKCRRSAALLEALHAHCGARLDQGPLPSELRTLH